MKTLLTLFATFFKIGAFTVGGGDAMIPFIQREVAEKRKWITDDDIFEIIAIAESTPGPIAINSATFIGYRIAGFWGSFFSTLGVVLPSFIIIIAISFVLAEFESLKAVQYAFNGIRAGVLALVVKAWWTMYKKCPKDVFSYVLAGLALIASAVLKVNVLVVVISCAVVGLIYSLISAGRAGK